MRAAFIPALPPSALLAGMIAPSFRLVNRFCGKSYCARAAAVSGRPRCARYFLGRRSLMCCFARAAAMSGRPRCARYGLGRRSLAGGSHTRPTLAMAWAVFAANAGGASVASALVAQETRLAAPRSCPRRAMLLVPVGKGPAACARSRRGRRVPAPTARAMGAGLPAPAARERFECPKARREACALWALGPKAQSDPKRGSETMSATVREARMIEQPGHKKRGKRQTAAHTAGPLARTSPQRFGEPQLSKLNSESSDMRGGFGSLAQARLPYAGRRPASRRQSRRRSRRPAQTPSEKIGASRAFPTRS